MASIGSLYALLKLDSKGFNRGMKTANKSMKNFSSNVNRTAVRLAGLYGVFASSRALVRSINTYTEMSNRLKLVTADAKNLADIQNELFEVAQKTRGALSTTVDLYSRLARSTQELGISQERLLSVTETINKAITISGSSTQASNAALIQLGQGLAAGALRGQELNSVMEQTPRLAQALADGLSVTIGELREMGKAGKITAINVIQALESQSTAVDKEFGQTEQTISQAMQRIENIALRTFGSLDAKDLVKSLNEFGETLEDPAIIDGLQTLAAAMLAVGTSTVKALASIKSFGAGLGIKAAQLIDPNLEDQLISLEARRELLQNDLNRFFSDIPPPTHLLDEWVRINQQIDEVKDKLKVINSISVKPLKLIGTGGAGAPPTGIDKEFIKSQEKARAKILALTKSLELQAATFGKTDAEILEYKLTLGQYAESLKILGLEGAGARGKIRALAEVIKIKTDVVKNAKEAQAQYNKDLAESKQIFEDTREPIEVLQRETEKLNRLLDLGAKAGGISFDTYARKLFKLQDAFDDLGEKVKKTTSISEELGFTFSSAFEDAIVDGGKLSDVLKGLEKDILRIITRTLITEPLSKSISGLLKPAGGGGFFENIFGDIFGGARARGGPTTAGVPYLVGEDGPEIHVPGRSGSIIPNGVMGGDVTINFAITTPTGNIPRESQSQISAQVARAVQQGRRNL